MEQQAADSAWLHWDLRANSSSLSMAVCQTAPPAESKAFQKAEHPKRRLSTSPWTVRGGIATEKKGASWKIEVYGEKWRKRANYLPIPLARLLKTTKNSICSWMRGFFFPPVKLNGHPTCCLVKWDHSRKMELARSHLLTARGRSEQQSLDQDLNFSPIQMCLDPEAGWHPSLLHPLCDYVWMALVLLTTRHVITCIWASFCKKNLLSWWQTCVMLCRMEIHP